MKTCKLCGDEKPYEEFHRDKKSPDGHVNRCKVCVKDLTKTHYQANREKKIAYQSEWSKNNREKTREYGRRHYERNAERLRPQKSLYSKSYAAANPDKRRMNEQARRGRKMSMTWEGIASWLELIQFYGDSCLKCGATDRLTLDHIVPLALGGAHSTNNFQILCQSCNSAKGARNSIDYRSYPKLVAILE